jgi:hypothetical protein
MPLVEGGARRQGEPGKPPQFIDAIANKDVVQMRTSTANRIAIAAVCHPEAANPLNVIPSAAASSRWKACGSNSDANRLISSRVTTFSGS